MKKLIIPQLIGLIVMLVGYAVACGLGIGPLLVGFFPSLLAGAVASTLAKDHAAGAAVWGATMPAWVIGAYARTSPHADAASIAVMSAAAVVVIMVFFVRPASRDLKIGFWPALACLVVTGAAVAATFGLDNPLPALAGIAAQIVLVRVTRTKEPA